MPSALYSRPVSWSTGERRAAVLIGAVGDRLPEVRIPITLEDVPQHLVQAVLAVEDQRFYGHFGLDLKRIAGALVANVKAGEISQGGSTITQQLAKNLFLSADRTPLRKLREAAMALVLEARYDKGQILEAYLNEIYLGQDGARQLHGVGAAARYYFGKDAGRVGLAEGALLAGLIKAPNRFSPTRHERNARKRRDLVLSLMTEQGRISRRSADQAKRVRLASRVYSAPSLDARYFRDAALTAVGGQVAARGAAVYTTLDAALQRSAERAVQDGLARIRGRDAQAALVAIDPRTGDLLAMVGGRDYGASQYNRALGARRQPGSAFKPIVALAAFHREGDGAPAFTLASRVDDEPLSVRTSQGRWEPTNYDHSFRGAVTVRQAIEQSLNVPFARIGLAVGPDRIVATARRLGIEAPLNPVPSLALGSSEVTLLELVRAYGVFATSGYLAASRMVLGRTTLGGGRLQADRPRVARVADPAETYLVTSALRGVVERGTARALGESGRFGTLAGKTGTSNDWRDAWFVAYSPTLVVGVWVGYDDGRSLGLSGADAALPIVARFLERADLEDQGESFPVPDGIVMAAVSEGNSDWYVECGREEVFLQGTAPRGACDQREEHEWDARDDHSDDEDDEVRLDRLRDRVQADQLRERAQRVMERLIEQLKHRVGREQRIALEEAERLRIRFRH
jgi:penicillin-binding protein 1B